MEITVLGTHRVSLKPERATLFLTAGFEGDNPEPVLEAASGLVARLTGEIRALRDAQPSPVTWHAVLPIRTRTWRPYNNQGKTVPPRHAASAELQVKFRDFDALARFVAAIGGREGLTIGRVEWALTEITRERIQAAVLAEAVANARARALTIARAAGASDVVAVEIADPGLLRGETGGGGAPMPVAAARMAAAAGSPPDAVEVSPEDVETQASVHARFISVAGA